MTSPTTHQGNIGQTAVMLDALKRGYHVSIPLEGAAYDLIVDRHGELFRVQVRSTTSRNGVVNARFRYSNSNTVDIVAVFDFESNKVFWIPLNKVKSTAGISIRLNETRQKTEHIASNYEQF